MSKRDVKIVKQTINGIERLPLYVPAAIVSPRTENEEKKLQKLFNKVNSVIRGQKITDITAALGMHLGQVVDFWHRKHPIRQRKAA